MRLIVLSLAFFGFIGTTSTARAEETVGEKAAKVGNDVKRVVKKGAHRLEESMCGKLTGDSKVTCLAKEAKNRASETVDAVVDKGSEIKNAADGN